MLYYRGTRTASGCEVVGRGGKLLEPRNDLRNHSPTGFEWGYHGSGPAQLALAILADHFRQLGNAPATADSLALRYYQQFKSRVIAHIHGDKWTLTTAEIEAGALIEPGVDWLVLEADA